MKQLLIGALIAAALPAAAMAQPADPNCVASNTNSRVEGTVLGAGAGALLGSVLAGHGSRGTGAVLGAIGGGVGGNVIAGARNQPCPPGYYYGPNGPPPPPGPGYNNGYPPPNNGYYNNGGYAAPPNGYYGANYVAPTDPGYGHFWNGAPTDISQRIDWMRTRIDNGQANGYLQPYQVQRAHSDLHSIRVWMRNRYNQNGGYLTADDRGYIQARLDHLGQSIHWMERTGY